eukprot:g23357.t1
MEELTSSSAWQHYSFPPTPTLSPGDMASPKMAEPSHTHAGVAAALGLAASAPAVTSISFRFLTKSLGVKAYPHPVMTIEACSKATAGIVAATKMYGKAIFFLWSDQAEHLAMEKGLSEPALKHIYSFWRQVIICLAQEEVTKGNFAVLHEGTAYHDFWTAASMQCHLCREVGHVKKNCPTLTATQPTPVAGRWHGSICSPIPQ